MIPKIGENELYSFSMDIDDMIHPIEFYQKFSYHPHSLLLMSAEVETKKKQKSIIILESSVKLTCDADKFFIKALNENGKNFVNNIYDSMSEIFNTVRLGDDLSIKWQGNLKNNLDEDERLRAKGPFSPLRQILTTISSQRKEDLFIAGNFSFDLIETFEKLPAVEKGLTSCPYFTLYISQLSIEINHQTNKSKIKACLFGGENYEKSFYDLSRKMKDIQNELSKTDKSTAELPEIEEQDVKVNVSDSNFVKNVKLVKNRILEGDIFQAVISRAFSVNVNRPLKCFNRLSQLNPSPYMFYMKDADFELFGASPESALKFDAKTRQVSMYPIAGTRRRGMNSRNEIDLDLDGKIEMELRSNVKEVAEHMMLVDLARNDIAKISQVGSRYVAPLMKVDRYERVMHLVSQVQGILKSDLDALHAYQATMNMGTLTGAPKISAMEILRNLEGKERGVYGGAVGYINGNGDMDTCIVIRSAFVKNGMAHVQAGAGIVHDSNPFDETQETKDKAFSVLKALGVRSL